VALEVDYEALEINSDSEELRAEAERLYQAVAALHGEDAFDAAPAGVQWSRRAPVAACVLNSAKTRLQDTRRASDARSGGRTCATV